MRSDSWRGAAASQPRAFSGHAICTVSFRFSDNSGCISGNASPQPAFQPVHPAEVHFAAGRHCARTSRSAPARHLERARQSRHGKIARRCHGVARRSRRGAALSAFPANARLRGRALHPRIGPFPIRLFSARRSCVSRWRHRARLSLDAWRRTASRRGNKQSRHRRETDRRRSGRRHDDLRGRADARLRVPQGRQACDHAGTAQRLRDRELHLCRRHRCTHFRQCHFLYALDGAAAACASLRLGFRPARRQARRPACLRSGGAG